MQTTEYYNEVKQQVNYSQTGRQAIQCPMCWKPAVAVLSRVKKNEVTHQSYRSVKTICRHCHGQLTFNWNSVTY